MTPVMEVRLHHDAVRDDSQRRCRRSSAIVSDGAELMSDCLGFVNGNDDEIVKRNSFAEFPW